MTSSAPISPIRLPVVAAAAMLVAVALSGCFALPSWASPKAELAAGPSPAPPSAPQAVAAIAGPTPASALVTWQPPAQTGTSPLLGYRLFDTVAGNRALIAELRPQERQFPVPGLAPGVHTFSVVAVSAAGESPAAAAAPLTIVHPPSAPGAPTGTAVAAGAARGTATVTWGPPESTGGSPITGYRIRHLDRASGAIHERTVGPGERSAAYTDLPPGDHAFSVSAFNAAGEGPAGASVGLNVPPPPGRTGSQSNGGGSTGGTQSAGGSGGGDAGGTGSSGGPTSGGSSGGSTATSGATSGGTGGTSGASTEGSGGAGSGGTTSGGSSGGSAGTSGGSTGGAAGGSKKAGLNSAPNTPDPDDPPPTTQSNAGASLSTPPGPPTNLAPLPGAQEGEAGLSWDPPASDGGAPILEYRVYRGVAPDALVLIEATSLQEAMHSGLASGATYYFAVSAVNDVGEGDLAGPMPVIAYGPPATPAPELPVLVLALAGLAAIAVALRRR